MADEGTPDPDQIIEGAVDLLTLLAWVGAGLLAAIVVAFLVAVAMRLTARRHSWAAVVTRRGRTPLRALLVVLGVWAGFVLARPENEPRWYDYAEHLLLIVFIGALTWLIAAMVYVFEDIALDNQQASSNRARRIRTQALLLRRVVVAVVVLLGIAGVLLTFPGARAAGASLFASAGIVSLVAGLAAQSALANVFAGMQLAFSDAIRVDDIVIAEGEWGRIEEITLTYVVLHTWDDRRLILPSTYFTNTPFENWTRRAGELLGTVEFDLDWRVPVAAMRTELKRLLADTDLWDGRVGLLQVFDATGGMVRVRALVSAADATSQIDLKYYLRESLLLWLQREAPYALPRNRFQEVEPATDDALEEPAPEQPAEETPDTGPVDAPAVDRLDPATAAQQEAALERERRRARRQRRRRPEPASPQPVARRPRPSSEETRQMDLADLGSPATGHEPEEADEQLAGTAARRTSLLGRLPAPPSVADESRFFTGSADAQARAQAFSGPGEEALQEREETAERHRAAARGDDPPEREGAPGSAGAGATAVMPAVSRVDAEDARDLPGGDIRGKDGGDGD